jgi:FixJ family two-component response regulator
MGDTAAIVAIVDDDDSVRRALHRLVASLAFSPAGFASGEEFLSSLGDNRPSCALLDLNMPGMKGLEVLKRMRAWGSDIPVIIITAFDQPGMRERCLTAGAAAYLIKPLEGSDLSRELKLALSG